MAGSEVYRIEIPIIIDDQSEAPLSQARERVNRFEQAAQKTNQRIRRMSTTDYRLRLSATDKARPTIDKVSRGLRSITSKAWNITLQAKDKVTSVIKNLISKITSPLALLGAGAGLGAGIVFPLKLAGEMEQAAISMEFFTGSAEKGQEFMKRLQKFAAKTPFEFPDVRDAAIGLMPLYKNMYGVEKAMDETMRTIRAFGDAAGLTGAGIQGMNMAMLGFRQIGTMGKLQMEELRQVTENLLIPMDIILKELGLTGDALEDLGKRGIDAKTAMDAIIRALEKNFTGGMEKMSQSLLGLTSTIKDTARLTVTAFGTGMAGPVRRVLLDIVGLTDDTSGKFEEFQRKLEQAGKRVGEYFERIYGRVKQFWGELSADPEFQNMDFAGKIIYILNLVIDKINTWLDSEGGKKLQETFAKIINTAIKTWLKGLENLGEKSVHELKEGDLIGAAVPAVAGWLLGGGLLAKGAWKLGKGIFSAGKWAFGKILPKTTSTATKAAATVSTAAEAAASTVAASATGAKIIYGPTGEVLKTIVPAAEMAASTAGTTSKTLAMLSKFGKVAGKVAVPLAIASEIYSVATAKDKVRAAAQSAIGLAGGWGGAKLGAAIGTAIAPGIGTAIGGALFGLGGYLLGRFLGGKTIDIAREGTTPVDAQQTSQKQIVIEVKAESKPIYNIETAVDADEILRIIKQNEKTIAEQLADDISIKLDTIFNNMPLVISK